jgi:hypothetical protein
MRCSAYVCCVAAGMVACGGERASDRPCEAASGFYFLRANLETPCPRRSLELTGAMRLTARGGVGEMAALFDAPADACDGTRTFDAEACELRFEASCTYTQTVQFRLAFRGAVASPHPDEELAGSLDLLVETSMDGTTWTNVCDTPDLEAHYAARLIPSFECTIGADPSCTSRGGEVCRASPYIDSMDGTGSIGVCALP